MQDFLLKTKSDSRVVDCVVVSEAGLIRRTLSELLDAERDVRVLWSGDRQSALEFQQSDPPPEVAVLHGCQPGEIDLTVALRRIYPSIRFVVVEPDVELCPPLETRIDTSPCSRLDSPFGEGSRAWREFQPKLLSTVRGGSILDADNAR